MPNITLLAPPAPQRTNNRQATQEPLPGPSFASAGGIHGESPAAGGARGKDKVARYRSSDDDSYGNEDKRPRTGPSPPSHSWTSINEATMTQILQRRSKKIKSGEFASPGLVRQLYAGTQCSNCSTRFPPTQTARYSQHLDWHFRQNGRDRVAKRRAQSRPWHYAKKDWLQYEEVEDLDKREKSWFEIKRANEAKVEVKKVSSVVAGALADDNCWVCGDKFGMFYKDDDDEWHLKDCMRHGDKNFHPVCLESYEKSPLKHERRYEVAEEETKERASIVITVPDDD